MADKVLKTSIENVGENEIKVSIEIAAAAFETAVNDAYLKNRHKITLPGFRKGRVPRKMLESQYGKNFFYEDAIEMIFTEVYEVAIKEHDFEPVSRPGIDELEEIEGGGMRLVISTSIKPTIEAPDYAGLEYSKKDLIATEDEILEVCKDNVEKNARVISVTDRPAADGDIVNIDFEGFADGTAFEGGKAENFELTLGSGSFIPGFEAQIEGKEVGDEFDVNVTFPEEYHAPDLAGKDSLFKVRLLDIKQRELPELNDEFAQEVSEHDTLEEYKAEIKEKIEESKKERADREIENELAIGLSKLVHDDIPRSMVDNEINRLLNEFADMLRAQGASFEGYMQATGMSMDAVRAMYEEQADQVVRGRLAIEAIVKKEGIEITEEEMDAEYARLGEMYRMEKQAFIDYIGETGAENVSDDLKAQKAMKMIRAVAVEVEKAQEDESDE